MVNKTIGEICNILSGYAFDSKLFTENSQDTPLIRIRDVMRGKTNTYTKESYGDKYIVKNGDLLIGMDGEFNIAPWKSDNAVLNQRVCKIWCSSHEVQEKYLIYFLPKALKDIERETSFVTVKHLSVKTINKIKIPIPPLETQKQITKTLDTISELLAMRKQQLAELGSLIKSIFYDMFGDPVKNEKGWPQLKLPQLVANSKNSLKRGPFGGALKKEIFVNEGYLVYEQNHALNNDYSFKRYFIDQKNFNKLKDFEVKAGDILISCSGVYLGKLSIVPKGALQGIINQALLKATLNNKVMNTVFFVNVFSNPIFKHKNITSNRGSGIPNLPPMSVMKNIDFISPPITLQNRFAQIVTKIEEQKALVKKAIDETQVLFDSLMSEYFE